MSKLKVFYEKNKKVLISLLVLVILLSVSVTGIIFFVNSRDAELVSEDVTKSLENAECSDQQLGELVELTERNKNAKASEQKAMSTEALANCYVLRNQLQEAKDVLVITSEYYGQAGNKEKQLSVDETINSLEQASNSPTNPEETPEGIPDIEDEGTFSN